MFDGTLVGRDAVVAGLLVGAAVAGASATASFADVAKWINGSGTVLPPRMMRVYYAKYSGGDFMHVVAHVAWKSEDHAAVEAWGRQAAAAVQAMVTGKAPSATMPAVPESSP